MKNSADQFKGPFIRDLPSRSAHFSNSPCEYVHDVPSGEDTFDSALEIFNAPILRNIRNVGRRQKCGRTIPVS